MAAIAKLITGDNSAKEAARANAATATVAAERQTGLQQQEQSRLDAQAGAILKSPRGQRLLLDGPIAGSNTSDKVG